MKKGLLIILLMSGAFFPLCLQSCNTHNANPTVPAPLPTATSTATPTPTHTCAPFETRTPCP
ncbi:MAG TPA: hypothetical protein VJ873_00385 [bacterium]|nr:hypothetical protein [bacterium]